MIIGSEIECCYLLREEAAADCFTNGTDSYM
jgi:hypothetical protein